MQISANAGRCDSEDVCYEEQWACGGIQPIDLTDNT